MASPALTSVPLALRRRSAVGASALAAVLLVAGVLPLVASAPSVLRLLAAFVVVAGLLTGFVALGLWRSITVVPVRGAGAGGGCGGGCQCGSQSGGC